MEGVKHDQGKVQLDLLPIPAAEAIAEVMQFGAKKYGSYNYLKGMAWSRLFAAALRHLFKFWKNQDQDEETGLLHLSHAGACVMMLITYQLQGLGEDDRFRKEVTEQPSFPEMKL